MQMQSYLVAPKSLKNLTVSITYPPHLESSAVTSCLHLLGGDQPPNVTMPRAFPLGYNLPTDPASQAAAQAEIARTAYWPDISGDGTTVVAPYNEGICQINVLQQENTNSGPPGNPSTATSRYAVKALLYDNIKVPIGTIADMTPAGSADPNNVNDPPPVNLGSKLEDWIAITPEATGDYIQFSTTVTGQSWKSTDSDPNGQQYCTVTDWTVTLTFNVSSPLCLKNKLCG
jgi:hypothetical protein